MSENQATAGFRNAGWTMNELPATVQTSVHPLATHDGAAVSGLLYRNGTPKTVFCIMHPREFMASHYLIPPLVSAGFAVWTQTSRSVGQDLRLEHELALLDVAAGMSFLRAQGFERIVLIGNSGGASLYGFYNQQSLLAPEQRLKRTPGGRPVALAEASMPTVDAIVLLSPHPGQGQLLLRCIDPAVTDESAPLESDASLDFLEASNGYRDGAQGSSYTKEFIDRHRAGQLARVQRLDALAKQMIEVRISAKARTKSDPSAAMRRAGAYSGILTIWRTDADLRCWDLSLDPSERKLGSVWGNNPWTSNFGVPGFGRLCTPEAWLSTWSGLSSKANLYETAAAIEQPCLQIEYTADNTVFPADGAAVFAAIKTNDKRRLSFRGDHHGRPLSQDEVPGRTAAAQAIIEWARDRF